MFLLEVMMVVTKFSQLPISEWSYPPKEINACIGIICSGELEMKPDIQDRIRQCAYLIGVDGGLNYCHQMNIKPGCAVGDFDSVNLSVLEALNIERTSLSRAKDMTDLEAAIVKAKDISAVAQCIIFAGLGGRIDHTLGNIFLLLRDPGKIFLESEHQVVFAINATNGRVQICNEGFLTLAIFPLNGEAQNVNIETNTDTISHQIVDDVLVFHFKENCYLSIGSGEVIVILDKREISIPNESNEETIHTDFSLNQPLIHIFKTLKHQSLNFNKVKLVSDKESIVNIQPSDSYSFPCQVGLTVSLIPFFGPAQNITTKGLKWELPKTVGTLDKNCVGISNVCLGEEFSVQVEQGELLCVINHDLIDKEMVEATLEH